MKKIYSLLLACTLSGTFLKAQTTAMDFTMNDCNGNMHNLFSTLDSQKVVILEYFHTCPSCASAADDLKPIYQELNSYYGNKVRFWAFPEDDTYACSSVLNWVSTNGFSSMIVPFDSGGVQTAYYGGMGMPTIAVVAGSAHKVLYLANQTFAYLQTDTVLIEAAIRNFLDSTYSSVTDMSPVVSLHIFPNPISDVFEISFNSIEAGTLKLELYSPLGQTITCLTEERIQIGNWNKKFSTTLPSGIYFLKGSINGKMFQEKIIVQY